jgi:hypothetical protein
VGEADTFFLALSGALLWIIAQGRQHPLRAGIGALIVGALVGLSKPNGLVLIPALLLWALDLSLAHLREGPDTVPRWRRALANTNPAWAAILGVLGIALATSWWIYQTSGYYPFYVLLLQRALWWREFTGGDFGSFAHMIHVAVYYTRSGQINMNELHRMSELSNVLFGLALIFSQLPPRWPGGERIPIPLFWRVGAAGTYALMFFSGQSHSVDRYAISNIFFVLIWWRLVFGLPGQPVIWRIRTLPGLMRWTWLALGPATWALAWLQLGWDPLAV